MYSRTLLCRQHPCVSCGQIESDAIWPQRWPLIYVNTEYPLHAIWSSFRLSTYQLYYVQKVMRLNKVWLNWIHIQEFTKLSSALYWCGKNLFFFFIQILCFVKIIYLKDILGEYTLHMFCERVVFPLKFWLII